MKILKFCWFIWYWGLGIGGIGVGPKRFFQPIDFNGS